MKFSRMLDQESIRKGNLKKRVRGNTIRSSRGQLNEGRKNNHVQEESRVLLETLAVPFLGQSQGEAVLLYLGVPEKRCLSQRCLLN